MSYSKEPMNRKIGGPGEDNPTEEQARDESIDEPEYDKGSDEDEEASDESGNHL